MSALRLFACLLASLGLAGAAGCTATSLADDPAATAPFAQGDPVLPDSVDRVPRAVSRADVAGTFTPSAYAGTTPESNGTLAATAAAMPETPVSARRDVAARSPELDALIASYAAHYRIPETLLRRVVDRESTFNPAARNGPYWGLMQIRHDTARTMGYRGPAEGLLDAETNLIYAGKYLRGAYLVADGDHDRAVRHYASGYYYHARDRGMLEATGLGKDRKRR